MKLYFAKTLHERMKFLRVYKYVGILKFILLFLVTGSLYSFSPDTCLESARVTLNLKNVTVKEVLSVIEKESELYFTYNSSHLSNRKTSITVENKTVKEVLDLLFSDGAIKYQLNERHVTLYRVDVKPVLKQTALQQAKKVTGLVVDESGIPVIGANVIVKSSKKGVITDVNGAFSIEANPDDILLVSYIGFMTREILVGDNSHLQIPISENMERLDEVVVVGYGTQKKVTMTGAVASIGGEGIMKTKNQFVSNTLAGKIPGLRVWEKTSEPGATSMQEFQIRGMGNPLVVIDGVPRNEMNRLDPNEIESISVLKDAAAAIYGVRAANGVILITTKKGTAGKMQLNYNGFFGYQKAIGLPDVLDALGYMTLMNERELNNGRAVLYPKEKLDEYRNGTKKSTDWAHMGQREFAPQQQHNVSVNGGTDKIKYFINFGYLNQGSFFETNSLNYERFNIRSNVSVQLTNRIKAEAFIGGWTDAKQSMSQNSSQLYKGIWSTEPTIPAYANNNPKYLNKIADGLHPLAITNRDISGYNDRVNKSFSGTFNLEYKIPFIDGLVAKGSYSYDYAIQDSKSFTKAFDLWEYKPEEDYYKSSAYMAPSKIKREYGNNENTLLQLSLTYAKRIKEDHNINILFLYEESTQKADNFAGLRETNMEIIDEMFAGYTANQQATQNANGIYTRTNKGFVGRINYDYKSKYIAEVSARYDGSSKFAPGHQWGIFPAVSVGWRISEESFFKNKFSFMDNLKLRASYGILGSDASSSYQFVSGFTYPSSGYVFDSFVGAVAPSNIPNPYITWYQSKTTNLGIDFSMWNGLLGGTFDYFFRDQTGLLASRAESLSSTIGATMSQENLNSDRRKGFEIELSHKNKIKDFSYSVSGNFGFTRNKCLYRERSPSTSHYDDWRNNNSDRYWDFLWGYGVNGQLPGFNDIYNAPNMDSKGNSTFFPGSYEYEDWNGDGMIDGNDMRPVLPNGNRITYGLTLEAAFKGFDFSALFQGSGIVVRTYPEQHIQPLSWGRNGLDRFMDRWHRVDEFDPNSEWVPGKYPSTYRDTPAWSSYNRASEMNRLDGSYLRLKSLEFGYSLPKSLLQKVNIQGARIFLNGYNLLTFSPVNGITDPERPDNSDNGYTYPGSSTYNIGVNLTF